ncbi:MAG TPA: hypothetical protein VM912_05040, partial [Terriglobales bacterium]|nr:hypothetical protein [Terriglobales bacterium]
MRELLTRAKDEAMLFWDHETDDLAPHSRFHVRLSRQLAEDSFLTTSKHEQEFRRDIRDCNT